MSQAPVSVPLLLSYSSLQLLPDRFVPISATNELYKALSQGSPDSAHYPHGSYSPVFPKTCIFAGLWLVAVLFFFLFFFFLFFLAVTLFPDSPSNFCMFLSVISKCLCWHKLLPTSGGKKKSSKALAHIRMPDLCQYLFPSWFGSRSSTCYGSSGCRSRSRCCGWSGVAGFKHTVQHASVPVPGGLRLKLSNEKQCVPNCPHSNSQLLGECGFWIMAKLTIFLFIFFSMLGLTPHEESLGY